MNFKSLQFGLAFKLLLRTMPILLVRLVANVVFWLVSLVYLGITGGIAWLVGQAVPAVGVILFIVALVAIGPLYKLAKRYVLYMIKAAHIAVVSELLVRDALPEGVGQLAWGKQRVQERFGEASIMFVVDELVSAVVKRFTRTVYRIASWLPGNTLRTLANIVNRVVRFAISYIDEAILARVFWLDTKLVWTSARDGVILYGMVWKPLLMNAIALMVLSYLPFIVVLIVFSAPVGALVSLISAELAGWSIIVTMILAFLVKMALGDSFAMTAMIAAYQRATAGLEPDPQVTAKLEQVSKKFGDLQARAQEELSRLPKSEEPSEPPTPAAEAV